MLFRLSPQALLGYHSPMVTRFGVAGGRLEMLQNKIEIYPGAFHLQRYLDLNAQEWLCQRCWELGSQPAGFYTPTVRYGAKMRLQMVCMGLHWNAKTYKYEKVRSDFDGLPVQPLPGELKDLAVRAATDVGMVIQPDLCILNYYADQGRLGLHQDKDESPGTIAAGVPVVSISVGDSAKFRMGGFRRQDPLKTVILASGDAFVFGDSSRLRYHGVSSILPGSAPPQLGSRGRFNLTFRQY